MAERLVDVDRDLLRKAKELLGTSTATETINRALDEVIGIELRRRHADRLASLRGLDLDDPEVMAGAWPPPPDI